MPELNEIGSATTTTNVTITTTTEAVAISSGEVRVPNQTARIVVIGWAQVTTGAATTTLTPRIRRGTAIKGTLVGEANAEEVKAAAGSTEPVMLIVQEDRANEASVEYSLTVQQASATGNGTILQAGIIVLVL